MDISKASNFERFVYDLLDRDAARVRALFRKVETHGGFDLSGKPGSDGDEFGKVAAFGFVSGRSVHADRIATIRDVRERHGVTIDPHTADGVKVARDNLSAGVPMLVLETALAAKFNDTIRAALGRDAERPAGIGNIEGLPQRFDVMQAHVDDIKAFVARHTGA